MVISVMKVSSIVFMFNVSCMFDVVLLVVVLNILV